MNGDVSRCVDSDSHFVASDLGDRDSNIIADPDDLVLLPAKY
jgi:hypothetical protein